MPAGWTTSGMNELPRGVHRIVANAANPATVADTWKVAFYDATATINADTQTYSATNEVTGGGYVAGGATVTPTISEITVGGKKRIAITFPDIEYTSSPTFSFKYAILYNATAGRGNRVIGWWSWTATQTASGSTYSIGPKGDTNMPPLVLRPPA